jgi:hypothetical protein
MRQSDEINFSKLLGFDALVEELSGGVDFQDETIAAKLGAKVGKPTGDAPATFAEAKI